jgi:hypothetical protein
MSYNGRVNFGLLADYDALPDVDEIAAGISESLEELMEAAKHRERAAAGERRGAEAGAAAP